MRNRVCTTPDEGVLLELEFPLSHGRLSAEEFSAASAVVATGIARILLD